MTRVLVVDDEPDIRSLIKHLLTAEGHEVETASDGGDALIHACQSQPEVIIMDVSMPIMNGFQVLEKLRGNPSTQLIPVILLTTLPPARGENAGRQLGVTHYLAKPWEPGTLETAIRVVLRESAQRQTNVVQ